MPTFARVPGDAAVVHLCELLAYTKGRRVPFADALDEAIAVVTEDMSESARAAWCRCIVRSRDVWQSAYEDQPSRLVHLGRALIEAEAADVGTTGVGRRSRVAHRLIVTILPRSAGPDVS